MGSQQRVSCSSTALVTDDYRGATRCERELLSKETDRSDLQNRVKITRERWQELEAAGEVAAA